MLNSGKSSPSILVVGAGELGTAILDALAKHPARQGGKITVLLRPSSINSKDPVKKAANEHIKSLGVELEAGDFINAPIPELATIFKKYDVVIQAAGYGMPVGTQLRVTKAALEAGVPRYFPWQFGMDYDAIGEGNSEGLFDEMLEVRKLLRSQSRTNWTIVSTGLFVSYLFLPGFGTVDLEKGVVRALGNWENRITVTTIEGIGTMVAEGVYAPQDTANRIVYVAGDTISYRQLADLLEALYSREFKRELWDLPLLKRSLADNSNNLFARYRAVFGTGIGTAWDMEKTLNYQRNITLAGVEAFVKENRENLYVQS